jgi:hypothetical protein
MFCKGVLPFEVAAGRPTEYTEDYKRIRGSSNPRDLRGNQRL